MKKREAPPTRSRENMDSLLAPIFARDEGRIRYEKLAHVLGNEDPGAFLAEVISRSDLLHWQRIAAGSLRDHWATHGNISRASLRVLWKYSVRQLARDPDEFERLIRTVCVVGDNTALDFAEEHTLKLLRVGDGAERHWAERAKRCLEGRRLEPVLHETFPQSLRREQPTVIALVGQAGDNSSALSLIMRDLLNLPVASFGDLVREKAGPNADRQALQRLGQRMLVELGPEQFCRMTLERAEWQPGMGLIVDGVRHLDVLDALKRIVQPAIVEDAFVKMPDSLRRDRIADEYSHEPRQVRKKLTRDAQKDPTEQETTLGKLKPNKDIRLEKILLSAQVA